MTYGPGRWLRPFIFALLYVCAKGLNIRDSSVGLVIAVAPRGWTTPDLPRHVSATRLHEEHLLPVAMGSMLTSARARGADGDSDE
jgi:hypothetical protein